MSDQVMRLFAVSALLGVPASGVALDVHTDIHARHQTIEGWGTSGVPSGNESQWLAAYRDLGLNILRLKMEEEVLLHPSGDKRVRVPLTSDLQTNIDRMDFSETSRLVELGETAQWLSQNALEPGRVRIVGSFWTPPHWMKGPTGFEQNFVGITSNYPTPFTAGEAAEVTWLPPGRGDTIGGRLRTEDPVNLAEYGEFAAAWIEGFEQEWGVPIYALSIQNEVSFENPFDSMTLTVGPDGQTDHNQYAIALAAVRDAWRRHGVETKIKGPHMAQVGPRPDNPWGLLNQMRLIDAVKNADDPTLIDFLDFYASNYYMNANEAGAQATAAYFHGQDAVDADWANWTYAPGVAQDGKPIWYSETGGSNNPSARNWANGPLDAGGGAITVALQMFNALVFSDASAYTYWQFTDGDNADTTAYSLVGTSHLSDPEQSEKYAAFKHFSRYVRPGAVRVESTFENDQVSSGGASEYDTLHGINVSSFLHEDDGTLTYVVLNLQNTAETVTLNLPADLQLGDFRYFRSTETERFEEHPALSSETGAVTLTLPRFSIVTLVADATMIPEPTACSLAALGLLSTTFFAVWSRRATSGSAIVAWLMFATASPAWAEHYDLYIAAGQSNIDGRGASSDLIGELSVWAGEQADAIIHYTQPLPNTAPFQTEWRPMGPGYSSARQPPLSTMFGPEVSFAGTLTQAQPGSKVAVVKVSRGGTNLANDWNPAGGYMYEALQNAFATALEALEARGDTATVRGFLWHQGESDTSALYRDAYEGNLINFIDVVRNDLVGDPDLPFVIGELPHLYPMHNDPIRLVQAEVASEVAHTGFVSSVGLTSEDFNHFDAPSLIELGVRFAGEIQRLTIPEPSSGAIVVLLATHSTVACRRRS